MVSVGLFITKNRDVIASVLFYGIDFVKRCGQVTNFLSVPKLTARLI